MILSRKNKFVFIKGRKVAGTSLEVLLADICGPQDIITPITPIDECHRCRHGKRSAQNYGASVKEHEDYIEKIKKLPKNTSVDILIPKGKFYNHMPYSEIEEIHGTIPEDWIVFAVERCPYYKIISLANFMIKFKEYRSLKNTMTSSLDELQKQIAAIFKNGAFVKVKNIDLYKDKSGVLKAEILKYEYLNQEIKKIMHKLHITNYPLLGHFKKGILSNNLNLQDVFSSEHLQLINDVYHEEFTYFGYEKVKV